jgi:hypothetical protein
VDAFVVDEDESSDNKVIQNLLKPTLVTFCCDGKAVPLFAADKVSSSEFVILKPETDAMELLALLLVLELVVALLEPELLELFALLLLLEPTTAVTELLFVDGPTIGGPVMLLEFDNGGGGSSGPVAFDELKGGGGGNIGPVLLSGWVAFIGAIGRAAGLTVGCGVDEGAADGCKAP